MASNSINTLADFPEREFVILVFCDACGHQAPLGRCGMDQSATIEDLAQRLRCSRCGSRTGNIRIIYKGAGEFRYAQ